MLSSVGGQWVHGVGVWGTARQQHRELGLGSGEGSVLETGTWEGPGEEA